MILLILSEIFERGVYSVKFECDINPHTARQMIRDVIRNTNVDDFTYLNQNEFIMIIDVLSKRKGPVNKQEIETIFKNYCESFQINYKHNIE